MSYRSFKHLLGETSLERKCRFIFGLGILVLVSGSFFWYGQKTEGIVLMQTTQTARMLVNPTLKDLHFRALGNFDFEDILDTLSEDFNTIGDLPPHEAYVLYPYSTKESKKRPTDANEIAALSPFPAIRQADGGDSWQRAELSRQYPHVSRRKKYVGAAHHQ